MTDQENSKQQGPYTPAETAKILGISVQSLKYHRLAGHIEGRDVGNTTLYTQEQIDAADLKPRKSGPKGPRKKPGGDDDNGSSMILMSSLSARVLVGAAS